MNDTRLGYVQRLVARDINAILSPMTDFTSDHRRNLRNAWDSLVGMSVHYWSASALYAGTSRIVQAHSETDVINGLSLILFGLYPEAKRYLGLASAQHHEDWIAHVWTQRAEHTASMKEMRTDIAHNLAQMNRMHTTHQPLEERVGASNMTYGS